MPSQSRSGIVKTGSRPRHSRNDPEIAMKVRDKHYRTIWVESDGWSVTVIDQTRLPFAFETVTLRTVESVRRGDLRHAGARRPADRRDGGLWHVPRRPRRSERCCPRQCPCHTGGRATHRRQSALGAGPDARCLAQPADPGTRGARLSDRRRDLRRGCRHKRRHRRAWPRPDPGGRRKESQMASRSMC